MSGILIANRGEIAVRIIRSCKKLGLKTIAIYSEADEGSFHTRIADEAVCIGRMDPTHSYLNQETVLAVAKAYRVSAIHPGVGFLSESPSFRKACEDEGFVFVGPDAKSIALLGDKQRARTAMIAHGIPVIPGSESIMQSITQAQQTAGQIGYPVMIKAANGGGGVGIRIAQDPDSFSKQYNLAVKEAKNAFGDESVYIETYLQNTRHVEVQILGDEFGNVVHFGTRECSIQRKNQKIIEEAPAPFISEHTRQALEQTAVKIGRLLGYKNAGTVEFLLTQDEKFYFMEMNTRIQVEHPVTEEVYGVDLIQAQIHAAFGHTLRVSQSDIVSKGHAIECRINAENPAEGFRPSPGVIRKMDLPGGYGVRVDSGYGTQDTVSPCYDSLLLKIICHGEHRKEAIRVMTQALNELNVEGPTVNQHFVQCVLSHKDYLQGAVYTKWIEEILVPQYMETHHEVV